jgi:hypothetical protein
VLCAVIGAGLLAAVGCATGGAGTATDSSWEYLMESGEEAARVGGDAEAGDFFGRAMELAIAQPHQPGRLAYSAWRLGDVCFRKPALCPVGEAKLRTGQALAIFSALYGPEHPVVIPILLRLAEIRAQQGDTEGAADLLERADQITARTFPESHFMRARSGAHRPAADLDPHELLQILADLDTLDG